VGTMTLYHYVRNKDELLALVRDTVMGELIVTDEDQLRLGWRQAMTELAHRTRAAARRHPWMFDIVDSAPMGPNAVRHLDQSLQAVASIDLPLDDRLAIADLVDEFVFGYCLNDRHNARARHHATSEMVDYLAALIGTGAYPALAAIADDVGPHGLWNAVSRSRTSRDRFHANLDRLLDGIEADLADRLRDRS
jgi:AcrR family transcriptional regulator